MKAIPLLLLCLLLPGAPLQADSPETERPATALEAPGTLSGYRRHEPKGTGKKPPQERPSQPQGMPRLAPPPVLRFHGDRENPDAKSFPQFGHTPGQGNPWEYGQPPVSPRDEPPPPPPISGGNPWSLDQGLLSVPGIPGLDRSLPLAPADPLLSPMPYSGLPPRGPYGYYPGTGSGLMPGMPFDNRFLPGYGGDRNSFPFSMPMDWFR